jgi:predicted ester cyclase
VLSAPTLSQPLSGREAIHLYESSIRNAMPDASVELINLVVEGNTLTHEFIFRATHTGALVKPEFTLPATGNSIELPMAIFVQLDDEGGVTQERRYLDGGTLLRLLGAP